MAGKGTFMVCFTHAGTVCGLQWRTSSCGIYRAKKTPKTPRWGCCVARSKCPRGMCSPNPPNNPSGGDCDYHPCVTVKLILRPPESS